MPTGTSNQTTTNDYGVTTSGGSVIASNDLMATLTQPGVSYTGASATTTYTYDALGEVITATDPNGSTHTYSYDAVGRRVGDAVTTLGSGVDGAIRRITTAYDTAGRPYLFTSYNAASGGTVVNQVQNVYNGLGQLTGQYQAVGGSVNTSTTPEVQYAYTEMSGGQDNSRMTSMTYPNGRVLDYVYNTGLDSAISRLSGIVDDATSVTLESYTYLGLGTVVARNHPQSGVNLTYIQQSGDTAANTDGGDPYTGLDRFGRVIDQNWLTASAGSSVARYQYGYDRSGNVLSRNDLVETALSELYHANSSASGDNATAYDALGRLTGSARGVLSSSGHNGATLDTVSSSSASQSWSLDALGNMTGVTTNGTTVTQGFNTLDQQTSTSSGTAPTYDADGNTLTSGGFTYAYDAWNRLAAVSTTSTSAAVASYSYDATGRRVVESYAGGSTTNLYYSPDWHVIEERQGGTASSNVLYQYILGATGNVVVRDTYSSGSLVSGYRLYTVWDANGDITALTNSSGAVQERYAYSAYGLVTVLTASGTAVSGDVSGYGWAYLYQGGRHDGATGLYIFQHRDYNPASGTWQERDPIGLAGGDENLYRFVMEKPLNYTDSSGLEGNEPKSQQAPSPTKPIVTVEIDLNAGVAGPKYNGPITGDGGNTTPGTNTPPTNGQLKPGEGLKAPKPDPGSVPDELIGSIANIDPILQKICRYCKISRSGDPAISRLDESLDQIAAQIRGRISQLRGMIQDADTRQEQRDLEKTMRNLLRTLNYIAVRRKAPCDPNPVFPDLPPMQIPVPGPGEGPGPIPYPPRRGKVVPAPDPGSIPVPRK